MVRLLLLALAVMSGTCFARANLSIMQAWEFLNQPGLLLDDALMTREGQDALKTLRENPVEAERLIVSALSFGGAKGKADGLQVLLIRRSDFLRVARTIVRTYPPLHESTPFLGTFALKGTSEDMDILKPWFLAYPNSKGVADLATIMTENPHAHDTLRKLKDVAPGTWQDALAVKRFFGGIPSDSPAPKKKDLEQSFARVIAEPTLRSETNSDGVLRPSPDEGWPLWLRWIAVGILLIGLLALLQKKYR